MVETGRTQLRPDAAILNELRYDRWREFSPEDTVRFYALRLKEAGMIKSSARKFSPRAPTGGS